MSLSHGSLDFYKINNTVSLFLDPSISKSDLHHFNYCNGTSKRIITECVKKKKKKKVSLQPWKSGSGKDKWPLWRLGVLTQRVRTWNCSKACSWRVPIWKDELYYLSNLGSQGNTKCIPYGSPASGMYEPQRTPGVRLHEGIRHTLWRPLTTLL